jgi:Rps23 Pro-64 3,4-dihydroxylase Tpa1-like proline 4-hydroxylase
MPSTAEIADSPATLRSHYLVIDDFLPIDRAIAMRRDIDTHFSMPNAHRPETHQVWNYWFVPELYTYLRTSPEKIIRPEHLAPFMAALRTWSSQTLGMKEVSQPHLSLYVSGCRQNLHNDAKNGRFAFVYSLTRNERRTAGGETIVLHEGDLFRSHLTVPAAGRNFFTAIEPKFNRLVIFDDRIPHGVERVDGSMDPIEGRFVLHGHLRDGGTIVEPALATGAVNKVVVDAMRAFFSRPPIDIGLCHGPLVTRLTVGRAGDVETCHIIVDRVVMPDRRAGEWDRLVESLVATLRELKFPPSDSNTTVIQPILFGGPLRQL